MQLIRDLIEEAKQNRGKAFQYAKLNWRVVRSRGVELACLDRDGQLIDPIFDVKLTRQGIRDAVKDGLWMGAVKFALTGGIDGADSVWAMNNWEYEPRVEHWDGRTFTADEIGVYDHKVMA